MNKRSDRPESTELPTLPQGRFGRGGTRDQTDQKALNCQLSPRSVSSWEREFRIKIHRGELPVEPVLLGNAGFVQDGHLTDEGLAVLRSQMPYADLTSFDRDRRLINYQ